MSRPVPQRTPDAPVYVCEAETGRHCQTHQWHHLCTLDADHPQTAHECACGHEWTDTDDNA